IVSYESARSLRCFRGSEQMVTRIAHLSDLHFGKRFDVDTWNAVKDDVAGFMPHLLVVSGDLVDDPSPLHLLAAKGELDQLKATANIRSNS
ncbi:MAG TPA: hypothetical protein VHX39_00920, partial [Acetobacteraceae bacterium]|nr:hypothetical protein [Acetobacteraceae bacterium]